MRFDIRDLDFVLNGLSEKTGQVIAKNSKGTEILVSSIQSGTGEDGKPALVIWVDADTEVNAIKQDSEDDRQYDLPGSA